MEFYGFKEYYVISGIAATGVVLVCRDGCIAFLNISYV